MRAFHYNIENLKGYVVSYEFDDLLTYKNLKNSINTLGLKKIKNYNTGHGFVSFYKGKNYTFFIINNVRTNFQNFNLTKYTLVVIKNEFNEKLKHQDIYEPKEVFTGKYIRKGSCLCTENFYVEPCQTEPIKQIFTSRDIVYVIEDDIKCNYPNFSNSSNFSYVWYDGSYGYMKRDAINRYCKKED